jgi:hypothetical protein
VKSLFVLLLSLPLLCNAQIGNDPVGARAAGMGNAGLNYTGIWSIFHNQAGLGHIDRFSAGAFYENKFLVSEFAHTGFGAAMPLKNSSIGLSYSNFGFSRYREGKLGVAYGLMLTDELSVGVQLNYHTLNINAENYGDKNSLTAEVGLRMQVSENVSLAAHIFNPTRTKLNDYRDERIPTVIRLGAAYQISEDVLFSGEAEKDIDKPALFRGGVEYQPADILYLRVGASSAPTLFAFGLGLKFEAFKFDLATTYHNVLGYSPQVSLTYAAGKK